MVQKWQGFTIIEVLVAVFIIGVATVGIVMGFSSGLAMVEEIRQMATADRIAQEVMEELRGGENIGNIPPSVEREETVYEIFPDPSPVLSALTQVTVTVEWTSHTGRNFSRSLVTYFTEDGITKK